MSGVSRIQMIGLLQDHHGRQHTKSSSPPSQPHPAFPLGKFGDRLQSTSQATNKESESGNPIDQAINRFLTTFLKTYASITCSARQISTNSARNALYPDLDNTTFEKGTLSCLSPLPCLPLRAPIHFSLTLGQLSIASSPMKTQDPRMKGRAAALTLTA